MLVQNHYDMDIRVRRKAEALVAAGYSVDVLALASSPSKPRSYALSGVNVFTVSLGKKRGSLVRYAYEYLAFLLWSFWKLLFLMEKKHYAIIDVNNLPDFLVFTGAYAKLRGAKIVFDMHEITPEFYISKYEIKEGSWLIRLLKVIERASFKFADHVLAINEPIQKLLESRGYAVDVAVDGMDGWNAVRTGHYDLVITDVDMPRMDGIELASLIKKDPELKSLPVMIVSYKDREEDRLRGLEAGADYYLTKGSFHDETLLQAVLDLIGEPET